MPVGLVDILASGVTDDDGQPLASGTVTFYQAGTSTLETVYEDFELTDAHPNPLTLDDAGRAIAYSDTRVKAVIRASTGAIVRTIDDINLADSDIDSSVSSATLAGDGLVANGAALDVNVDGSTLTTSGDEVKVADDGITPVQLAEMSMGPDFLTNYSISCAVATNALTISLKTLAGTDPSATDYCAFAFRSTTLTSGVYSRVNVTAATSLTISSGSTLGHTNSEEWPIYVYAINNAGTVELAASTSPYDERYRQSTTAEGGAGAADSPATLYSTTARTNVAIRLIAVLKSTQTAVGTWAAVPTHVSNQTKGAPLAQLVNRPVKSTVGVGGMAISSSSGSFSRVTSSDFADITNLSVTLTTSGRPVLVMLIPDGTNGATNSYTNYSGFRQNSLNTAAIRIYRDSTVLSQAFVGGQDGVPDVKSGPCYALDFPSAGTYVYKAQLGGNSAGTVYAYNMKLAAFEL